MIGSSLKTTARRSSPSKPTKLPSESLKHLGRGRRPLEHSSALDSARCRRWRISDIARWCCSLGISDSFLVNNSKFHRAWISYTGSYPESLSVAKAPIAVLSLTQIIFKSCNSCALPLPSRRRWVEQEQ
jgi:hypothetical protein